MKFLHKILLGILIIIYPVFFLLIEFHITPIISYTEIFITSSLFFIAAGLTIIKFDVGKKYLILLIGLSILIRIMFLFVHPIGSDDYYRYVWDGKVQASGINPYQYAPDNNALISLHTKTLPEKINFADMKTIYPPLSEIIFYFAYLIGGESYIGIKLLLLIFDLLSMTGIFLILKKIKLDFKYLLIYALCPLIIFQFFIDAHLDGFGLPLMVFAIYLFLDNKKIFSYILIGFSICIKPLAIILIPILFFTEKDFKEKIKIVLIPAFICVIMYLPFVFTGSPFQALIKFTENWTFNGVVFNLLDSFIHDNQRTRLICAVLLFVFYLPVILSKKDLFDKIYLSIFLLFIFSPVVHPWYLTWLAVLLPFIPRQSGIVFVGLVSLTVFTVLNYQLTGNWKEYTPVLILEYVPVIILFLRELFDKKNIIMHKSI